MLGGGPVSSSGKLAIGRNAGPPSSRMLAGLGMEGGVGNGACRLPLKAWLIPERHTGTCHGRGPGARSQGRKC